MECWFIWLSKAERGSWVLKLRSTAVGLYRGPQSTSVAVSITLFIHYLHQYASVSVLVQTKRKNLSFNFLQTQLS